MATLATGKPVQSCYNGFMWGLRAKDEQVSVEALWVTTQDKRPVEATLYACSGSWESTRTLSNAVEADPKAWDVIGTATILPDGTEDVSRNERTKLCTENF